MTARFFIFHATRARRWAPLLAVALAASACHKDEVQFYRVAKGDSDTASPRPSAPGDSTDPRIHWSLPAGWTALPGNEMRVGNFIVAGADGRKLEITVIPFPGSVGTEIDNVNRWRGQIKLPPVTPSEIKSDPVAIGGNAAKLYDMTATEAGSDGHKARLVAAVAVVNDVSWFFKMSGDDDMVADQRPRFDQFLKSVSFGGLASSPSPAQSPPQTDAAPMTQPVPQDNSGAPKWDVPADWKAGPPSSMRKGSFVVGGGESSAEISVTAFPGDVGGPLANVNRWRGQVGLDPVAEAQLPSLLTPLDVAGEKAMLVDMNGQSPDGRKSRIVAVSVSRAGSTWFFKMSGADTTVAAQKAAFLKFVQSTKFPNG